ncbi:hypothetical protein P7K49_016994 [Saguinus oedipus]|uniref:Nucleophosmin n=1 Tax=Saguinus oedipus TaxID=9490 RepID=A0ABQ9V1B5_SAGOE|nr:hypothetical protein P7K49_016994 [Saguinus oedipus]
MATWKTFVEPTVSLGGFEITPPMVLPLKHVSGPAYVSGQDLAAVEEDTESEDEEEEDGKLLSIFGKRFAAGGDNKPPQKKVKCAADEDGDEEGDDDDDFAEEENEEKSSAKKSIGSIWKRLKTINTRLKGQDPSKQENTKRT